MGGLRFRLARSQVAAVSICCYVKNHIALFSAVNVLCKCTSQSGYVYFPNQTNTFLLAGSQRSFMRNLLMSKTDFLLLKFYIVKVSIWIIQNLVAILIITMFTKWQCETDEKLLRHPKNVKNQILLKIKTAHKNSQGFLLTRQIFFCKIT